jgi:(2R)-sulfolactate sulfo-lyase subunit alpha
MVKKFWVHDHPDSVGVAVEDIAKGEAVLGAYMDSAGDVAVTSADLIPLGHKIALRDITKGEKVLEYGEVIGQATDDIRVGQHVHTHNLRSIRWGSVGAKG